MTVEHPSVRLSRHSPAAFRCYRCCNAASGQEMSIDCCMAGAQQHSAAATPQHVAQQHMWAVSRLQLT